MYCKNCGTKMSMEAAFCHKCGIKIVYGNKEPQVPDNIKEEILSAECDSKTRQEGEGLDQIEASESFHEKEETKFKKWWSKCSKGKRIFLVLGALLVGGVVLYALVAFLKAFGGFLFGIILIAGFIISLITGSEEEKIETRKIIVKMVVGGIIIFLILYTLVLKPDFLSNIFQPGASVRNAYLSEYSESITIEDAFESFFEDGKWSVYKEEDYSYVAFNGVFEYLGEKADAKVTFKITGKNFVVDRLDINGKTQNNIILYALFKAIYEE